MPKCLPFKICACVLQIKQGFHLQDMASKIHPDVFIAINIMVPNHAECNRIQAMITSAGSCEKRTKRSLGSKLMDLVALGRRHTGTTDGCCCIEQGCLASYWRGLGQLRVLGQLMDVVALSRVSSQLLKGVRAASYTWTTDGCCCIEQGCLASYWRGLGQLRILGQLMDVVALSRGV